MILDSNGEIVATNRAWQKFGLENGGEAVLGVGANYLTICDAATGNDSEGASEVAAAIRALIQGNGLKFSIEYPCFTHAKDAWFVARGNRFDDAYGAYLLIWHEDISEHKAIQNKLKLQSAEKTKPEQQGRIFESFANADASTSRRFGGKSLGLSISQRLLKLMPTRQARSGARFSAKNPQNF